MCIHNETKKRKSCYQGIIAFLGAYKQAYILLARTSGVNASTPASGINSSDETIDIEEQLQGWLIDSVGYLGLHLLQLASLVTPEAVPEAVPEAEGETSKSTPKADIEIEAEWGFDIALIPELNSFGDIKGRRESVRARVCELGIDCLHLFSAYTNPNPNPNPSTSTSGDIEKDLLSLLKKDDVRLLNYHQTEFWYV